jgi:UDP-glucose 4-epimerase
MKILVTGGGGFIGSHVVDAYCRDGHSVVVVDDLSTGRKENINSAARFYHLDIRSPDLGMVFEQEKPEVVNHHAAQMDVRRSVADPVNDAMINVVGGLNLFECCRMHHVRKVIFASTGGAIYGEQKYFPADEDHPTSPLSPYGIAKLTSEKYLFFYNQVYGLDSIILRYANVYGPRQNPHGEAGVIAIFAHRMLAGEQPIINGDGTQTRDYTYVGDVVRANQLALASGGYRIYNVGTGVETDVKKVFRTLRSCLAPSCKEAHGPAKAGEQLRSVINCARIHKELGWRPLVHVDEGLALTAASFQALSKGSR